MSQVALMFHTCLLQQLQLLVDSSFVLLVKKLFVFFRSYFAERHFPDSKSQTSDQILEIESFKN